MVEGAHAIPNTNIANKTKIRKGNMKQGWKSSEVIIEEGFAFNPSDHPRIALEKIARREELIPFEFEFYTPETVEEAVKVYMTAKSKGLLPMYYSGGTEFISRARRNEVQVDCRSCTVLVNDMPLNACHMLVVEAKDKSITTIEGFQYSPIQEKFIQNWAI